jgi:CheY-like chemotaxis protein
MSHKSVQICQAITNLVGNAIKFTPSGHVRIAVDREPHEQGSGRMRVSVSDTGIGIPPDKIPLLFAKFTQADTSTTRRYGDTGLGLAISKQLVEIMGGSITVESRLGEGSRCVFTLALPRGMAGPASVPTSDLAGLPVLQHSGESDTPKSKDSFTSSHLRVLVVEDNVINLKPAIGLLEKLGLRADVAANGIEAPEMSELFSYDVIFMDCQKLRTATLRSSP